MYRAHSFYNIVHKLGPRGHSLKSQVCIRSLEICQAWVRWKDNDFKKILFLAGTHPRSRNPLFHQNVFLLKLGHGEHFPKVDPPSCISSSPTAFSWFFLAFFLLSCFTTKDLEPQLQAKVTIIFLCCWLPLLQNPSFATPLCEIQFGWTTSTLALLPMFLSVD